MCRPEPASDLTLALLVDPSRADRERLSSALARAGLDVKACPDRASAQEMVNSLRPALLVTELRLQDGPALGFIERVRRELPDTRVIAVTAHGSIATAVRCARLGVTGYFAKPANVDDILIALRGEQALADPVPSSPLTLQRALWEYINQAVEHGGSIAGGAKALGLHRRSLRRMLAKYAPPDSGTPPALDQGERDRSVAAAGERGRMRGLSGVRS
jgi:two-component system response regulator RegA